MEWSGSEGEDQGASSPPRGRSAEVKKISLTAELASDLDDSRILLVTRKPHIKIPGEIDAREVFDRAF